MKRFALAAIVPLILTVSILLLSCAAPKTTVYVDPTRTIFVKVNEEFAVGVPANPTTGYQWKESHDTSLLNLIGSEYKASKQTKGGVGAGGTQYFKFKALKTGMTKIDLTYQHPKEGIIADITAFIVVIE